MVRHGMERLVGVARVCENAMHPAVQLKLAVICFVLVNFSDVIGN